MWEQSGIRHFARMVRPESLLLRSGNVGTWRSGADSTGIIQFVVTLST